MRHASHATMVAVFLSLAATLIAGDRLFAADRTPPAAAKPGQYTPRPSSPYLTAPNMEKLKELGAHLGRALDIAVELFSGNKAELLSKNKTALLSGNRPTILSGNNPKVLSENTTPILSGNTFSVLSNIKVEIHIENSGNNAAGGATAQPDPRRGIPSSGSSRTTPPKR